MRFCFFLALLVFTCTTVVAAVLDTGGVNEWNLVSKTERLAFCASEVLRHEQQNPGGRHLTKEELYACIANLFKLSPSSYDGNFGAVLAARACMSDGNAPKPFKN